jgi:hypothetical protein
MAGRMDIGPAMWMCIAEQTVRSRYEKTVTVVLFRYGSLCRSSQGICNRYILPTAYFSSVSILAVLRASVR